MAPSANVSQTPQCPRCGATAHLPGARFCGHCGASLEDGARELPAWQRPANARYSHVSMARIALSCPECGEPMRFGFRHVCRREADVAVALRGSRLDSKLGANYQFDKAPRVCLMMQTYD